MQELITRLKQYADDSLEHAEELKVELPATAAFERGRAAGFRMAAKMIEAKEVERLCSRCRSMTHNEAIQMIQEEGGPVGKAG